MTAKRIAWVVVAAGLALAPWHLKADDALETRASWAPPSHADVQAELEKWLSSLPAGQEHRQAFDAIWAEDASLDPSEALHRLAASAALVHGDAKALVELCSGDSPPVTPPSFAVLGDETVPAVVRNNLRLVYGQWLAQNLFYDEALEQLQGLTPADVVDPAALLFHQSVCFHKLRMKDDCLPAVAKLLEREKEIPERYATIARLIDADIRPLKPDSLDEVARLMDNIERVLGLGRAGAKVRKEEDDVIAKLDKMIEELEKQRQQMQQQAAGGSANPSSPAQDSTPLGGRGEGNVDPKRISNKDDWGNLPDKERDEALQGVLEELPGHYRKAIEEYLRKLARDGVE
jgi:hypothetical protein